MTVWTDELLQLARERGWPEDAHKAACEANDMDAITLTHPANWLTEDEVEGSGL